MHACIHSVNMYTRTATVHSLFAAACASVATSKSSRVTHAYGCVYIPRSIEHHARRAWHCSMHARICLELVTAGRDASLRDALADIAMDGQAARHADSLPCLPGLGAIGTGRDETHPSLRTPPPDPAEHRSPPPNPNATTAAIAHCTARHGRHFQLYTHHIGTSHMHIT